MTDKIEGGSCIFDSVVAAAQATGHAVEAKERMLALYALDAVAREAQGASQAQPVFDAAGTLEWALRIADFHGPAEVRPLTLTTAGELEPLIAAGDIIVVTTTGSSEHLQYVYPPGGSGVSHDYSLRQIDACGGIPAVLAVVEQGISPYNALILEWK